MIYFINYYCLWLSQITLNLEADTKQVSILLKPIGVYIQYIIMYKQLLQMNKNVCTINKSNRRLSGVYYILDEKKSNKF